TIHKCRQSILHRRSISVKTEVLGKAERTQERILDAATFEFAAYGVAGARVDRIAKEAKANKSLIYDYFGSKELLFQRVLERHLAEVYQTVHFSAEDLPGYAARLFDFAMDHPHLMRLVMWNGLEQNPNWPLDENSSLDAQAQAIRKCQDQGRIDATYSPEFLLTMIITLASAWTAANPFGISITPNAAKQRASLRTSITRTVEQLCYLPD
ncbi:TetR family transcriptional regulator, partial [Citrobacter amalonaticus]|uniref:TetR family transcriptional regulator n=1 Tax=Citrobacter amalonaticus TaxID=35703 RepID=UPI002FE54368